MGTMIGIIVLLAIDQCGFTNILHRPLIACTLLGAVSGNIQTGILTGTACELSYIVMTQGMGLDTNGSLLYAVAAYALASGGTIPAETASVSGLYGFAAGNLVDAAIRFAAAALVPSARKAAENRKDGMLGILNLVPMILSVVITAVLGSAILNSSGWAEAFLSGNGKFLLIAACAGILLECVGFAIVLRNIGAKSHIAAVAAGFAAGVIALKAAGPAALLLCGMIAAGFVMFVYNGNAGDRKTSSAKADLKKGGNDKWW